MECLKCQKKVPDLEKHNWLCHPTDAYQKKWSDHYMSGFNSVNCSSYYHDDPYY